MKDVKKKMRYFYKWLAVMVAVIGGSLGASGCLNAQQLAALGRADRAAQDAALVISSLDEEKALIAKWVKEKKINPAEGIAAFKRLAARRETFVKVIDDNVAAAKDIRDTKTPWYGWVMYGATVLTTLAGSFLGVRKVGSAAAAVGAIGSAFGSVSRGLDSGLANIPTEHADTIRGLMGDHIEARGHSDDVKALHHRAIAGDI